MYEDFFGNELNFDEEEKSISDILQEESIDFFNDIQHKEPGSLFDPF